MAGVLKSPCASSQTTAISRCRRWSPAATARPARQSPDSSSGRAALATASATARWSTVTRPSTAPSGSGGSMVLAGPAGTGKSGMCSSRCQGTTMRSQSPLVLAGIGFSPFPLGKQVPEPQQLRGAILQVGADLVLGLGRGTAQRVEQQAVVVGAAAE